MNPPAPRNLARALSFVVAAVLLVVGYGLLLERFHHYPAHDPDRYFHLAISRMVAEAGILRSVPQVSALGWGDYFPDKEFLFHAVTGAAHAIGGEVFVGAVAPLLAAACLLLLLFVVQRHVSPFTAFVVVTGSALLTPEFIQRLFILRPHSLAIFWFILIVHGLAEQRRVAVGAGCALFALSYHATFVPLALLGVASLIWLFHRNLAWKRTVTAGLVGVVIGTVSNPYFPSNITMGWVHLKLALHQDPDTQADIGIESVPVRADHFLTFYGFHLAALAIAIFVLISLSRRAAPTTASPAVDPPRLHFLVAASALFWALAIKNPRAAEYATPLTAVMLGALLATRHAGLLLPGAVAVLIAVVQLPQTWRFVDKGVGPPREVEASLAAAEHLPVDKPGALVFNCEWHRAPFVLYRRPDLRVVDVLEPSLLLAEHPELFKARQAFRRGDVPDAANMLRHLFGASYVLCQARPANEQMDRDPRFVRLYPADDALAAGEEKVPYVFALRDDLDTRFSTHALASPRPLLKTAEFLSVVPSESDTFQHIENRVSDEPAVFSPIIDLWSLHSAAAGAVDESIGPWSMCTVVRVPPDEVARHAGKTLLGLGGGRHLRVWLDGEPLFTARRAYTVSRLISVLVPLPRPITGTERIEAVFCSSTKASYHAAVFSWWQDSEIEALCDTKTPRASSPPVDETRWRFTAIDASQTCLAPRAWQLDSGR